jgi:hypothetical protein
MTEALSGVRNVKGLLVTGPSIMTGYLAIRTCI